MVLFRNFVKKLLAIGLFTSVITWIGAFLPGYAEELPGVNPVSALRRDPLWDAHDPYPAV